MKIVQKRILSILTPISPCVGDTNRNENRCSTSEQVVK